ncbi:DNA-binding domain-containing protein [Pseudorhodobacter ferrugineus]|uniref:DNA-binding domain-containing protein n=1 Tax=Pseudorhodobacter ferrugineus TaxID=77008 RepID=UPI0003B59A29|nr:DNA-binding domain-containing protein [Pseudorhodobacter ferrugineus]
MYIYVYKLKGLEGVPNDRTAISAWLSRHSITAVKHGHRFVVNLSDLPAPVRLAYVEREIEAAGLFGGTYDEEAHTNFMKMTPAMRDGAERKAEIARFLLSVGKLLPWSQKIALARKTFGESGTSEPSIARILKAVKGVDPVNFAPALLADYTLQGAPKAAVSDEAWSFFMTTLRDAGTRFPLKQAWRDVRDLKAVKGWDWPSFETINRRWHGLTEAQRLHARHGHEATVRAARGASADVTLTLTEHEVNQAEVAMGEVEHLFIQAARVFELLHTGIVAGHLDPEGSGTLAVLDLAKRAMMSAAEHEGEAVSHLAQKLRKAKSYQHPKEEQAA